MQGRLDSPLTEAGKNQAHIHGKTLKMLGGIDQLFVSPSGRTRETASIINSYAKATLSIEDALMERDCGEWSGELVSDIESFDREVWKEREADRFQHRPPGGENLSDMHMRVSDFLESLQTVEDDVVGLVTHGVMSRVIIMAYLGLTRQEAIRVQHPNDAFYRLSLGTVDIEADHFRDGEGPKAGLLRYPQAETIAR